MSFKDEFHVKEALTLFLAHLRLNELSIAHIWNKISCVRIFQEFPDK